MEQQPPTTDLVLPPSYKRPSIEEFVAAGYKAENYEQFFAKHEEQLARHYAEAPTDLPDAFYVRSQVRRVGTRTLRAKQPTRARFKQYLFGDPSKRLVRNRPLRISLAELSQNIDTLAESEAAGLLSVHMADGRRVDLKALKGGYLVLGPVVPASPPPNPPLDSIANDLPSGNPMPTYVDGTFPGDPVAERTLQELTAQKRKEAERQGADEESGDPAADPAAGDPAGDPAQEPAADPAAEEAVDPADLEAKTATEQPTHAESPAAKQGKQGKHGKHGKERG